MDARLRAPCGFLAVLAWDAVYQDLGVRSPIQCFGYGSEMGIGKAVRMYALGREGCLQSLLSGPMRELCWDCQELSTLQTSLVCLGTRGQEVKPRPVGVGVGFHDIPVDSGEKQHKTARKSSEVWKCQGVPRALGFWWSFDGFSGVSRNQTANQEHSGQLRREQFLSCVRWWVGVILLKCKKAYRVKKLSSQKLEVVGLQVQESAPGRENWIGCWI